MENLIEQGMLYDCYGALLTPHQQKIYEMAVYQDLSLYEIAEQTGVSRQAVSDLLRRVSAQLERYEAALGLAARSRRLRRSCEELEKTAVQLAESCPQQAQAIRQCAQKIRQEL